MGLLTDVDLKKCIKVIYGPVLHCSFTQTKRPFYLFLSGFGLWDSMTCVSGSRAVFLFKEHICCEEMCVCLVMGLSWTVNCMCCCLREVWHPPCPCCVSVGQRNMIRDRTCPVGRWNLITSSCWQKWDFWETRGRTNGVSGSSLLSPLGFVF